jgi:hypothetical protein
MARGDRVVAEFFGFSKPKRLSLKVSTTRQKSSAARASLSGNR